jgi:hypothetical protein
MDCVLSEIDGDSSNFSGGSQGLIAGGDPLHHPLQVLPLIGMP